MYMKGKTNLALKKKKNKSSFMQMTYIQNNFIYKIIFPGKQ